MANSFINESKFSTNKQINHSLDIAKVNKFLTAAYQFYVKKTTKSVQDLEY